MVALNREIMLSFTLLILSIVGSESFTTVGSGSKRRRASYNTHPDAPRKTISTTAIRTYEIGVGEQDIGVTRRSNLFSVPSLSNNKKRIDVDNYNPEEHENKHSASDWLYNVFSLPSSQILREIRNPVIAAAAWGTVVSIIQKVLAKSTSETLRKVASDICIGTTPHSFLVSSLGLLLVFRTNSAYGRFNEGRKIWGNILNDSRSLSRMITLYSKEVGSERKLRILNLLGAFSYLLRHHVREGCLCEETVEDIPKEHAIKIEGLPVTAVETRHEGDKPANGEHMKDHVLRKPCWVDKRNMPWNLFENKALKHVANTANRPLWVTDRISREVMSIPYGPNFTSRERLTLLGKVDKLTNAIGECERIHQTAVPLNYARHALRSLTLWLFTLPFAVVKDLGSLTGPVVGIVAWLMFGVYQIGYSIEDPFKGSLRLSILCDAIRKDVMDVAYAQRSTAFSLDEWDSTGAIDENFDDDDDESMTRELENASRAFVSQASVIDQAKIILEAPQLVKENNGSWNVVGMVEG